MSNTLTTKKLSLSPSTSHSQSDLDYIFNIVIIGDSESGKTCFINQFLTDEFEEHTSPTLGIEFCIKTHELPAKFIHSHYKYCKLHIWDTSGNEKYRSIVASYFTGAHCIIILFDLTNNDSFNNLEVWIEQCTLKKSNQTKLILVGNKSDLEDKITVKKDEIDKFISNNSCILSYFNVSSKTGNNIDSVFDKIMTLMVDEIEITAKKQEQQLLELQKNKPKLSLMSHFSNNKSNTLYSNSNNNKLTLSERNTPDVSPEPSSTSHYSQNSNSTNFSNKRYNMEIIDNDMDYVLLEEQYKHNKNPICCGCQCCVIL